MNRSITLLLFGISTITSFFFGASPKSAQLCFSETGQCIEGRFLEYWRNNGGLPVFGYPKTEPKIEINTENGKSYLTQWFERNRFEFHPENSRPYDVLLGRLGQDHLLQQDRIWQSEPKAAAGSEHYFPETGQAIDSHFWGYWRAHGLDLGHPQISFQESLALFGLPLTQAKEERNPTDGNMYLTQWFERARFELHPGSEWPVQQGLLGNELRSTPDGAGPLPPSVEAPTTDRPPTERPTQSSTQPSRPTTTGPAHPPTSRPGVPTEDAPIASPEHSPTARPTVATVTSEYRSTAVPTLPTTPGGQPKPTAYIPTKEPTKEPTLVPTSLPEPPTNTALIPTTFPTDEPTHTAIPIKR